MGIQLAIKLLTIVIFLGYGMIWILMPTNVFWLHWLPDIHAKVDTTYFGLEGANILIYTFPVLFIAVLGCLYLHLGKNDVDHKDGRLSSWSNEKTNRAQFFLFILMVLYLYDRSAKNFPSTLWTKLALVKGPLGIVSWTELTFFSMFIGLLFWSFSAYLHGMTANITRKSAAQMGEEVWEVKLDSAGLLLGLLGNICLAFLFFPVTRGSSILRLVGLTSESSIKYHIWLGHITMTFFTTHGLCYIIFWIGTHQISEMLMWAKVGISNLAGVATLLSGLAMWITSFPSLRRNIFELFFYTHHLYILFIIFFIFHVGFSYFCITLPGFYLFLIDRYLRFLQSQQKVSLVSARILPCQSVELNFSKSPGLSYTPTSIMFINMPCISKIQWHPFTVTSNSSTDPEKLSVIIKSEGSWSQKLFHKISSSSLDHHEVSIEGPYGPASTHFLSVIRKMKESGLRSCPTNFLSLLNWTKVRPSTEGEGPYGPSSTHFLRHDTLVMVSGGSGITPFISIIRELLFIKSIRSCMTKQVLLVTAFKKSVDLTLLELLLPVSRATYDISGLPIRIEAYVTRETEATSDYQKPCRTIQFKPSAMDVPVSAILGSNSWFWLGTIISSSFVIFLLLIGSITQYYIYPIDHNSDKRFPHTLRSVMNMLFVCVSIAMTATAAFLWKKTHNAKEMRQIQDLDMPTPMTSPRPASQFYNEDTELESLPHQSLVQNTKVHYGERPNLKKLIRECDGSSIGVLVSGPKKMRQEVAAICSSCEEGNLHFESISFTW